MPTEGRRKNEAIDWNPKLWLLMAPNFFVSKRMFVHRYTHAVCKMALSIQLNFGLILTIWGVSMYFKDFVCEEKNHIE